MRYLGISWKMEKSVVKFRDIMNGTGFTSTVLYHFFGFAWLENKLVTACNEYILHCHWLCYWRNCKGVGYSYTALWLSSRNKIWTIIFWCEIKYIYNFLPGSFWTLFIIFMISITFMPPAFNSHYLGDLKRSF